MHFKKILAVTMAVAMAFSTFGVMGTGTTKKAEAATFTDLDQNEIVAAMGAGWNLGNQLESSISGTPSETAWGNPTISASLIKAVKNAGFKTIRIPVSYLSMIGSGSSYTINSSWLDRVQEVVDMCIDNGLYVVINMHGDGYNSVTGGWLLCNGSDQTTIRAKYKACWKQIATRFASYDQHLIFESMNEEFDGTYTTPNTTYYSNINKLNQIFVDTVRQTGSNNALRWLMIPGWNTNIEYTTGSYGFSMPTDTYRSSSISSSEKRIMVSVHYYDPYAFCLEENSTTTQWGDSATNSSKVASYGDESYLNTMFKKLYTTFTSKGYPVVIGEYGAADKSSLDSTNTACRAEFATKVCTYAYKYGCVPIWWDNGTTSTYGFALFNRSTYKVTQQKIIDGIMSVYGVDTTKTYMLKNVNSSKYMDVSGAKAANGTNVIQYSASKAKSNNTWKFVSDGAGYYYIYSCLGDGSTYLLDVTNNSSANGANIEIYKNTSCNAQKYKVYRNSDGTYTIYTKSSSCKSCVEVVNGLTTNSANIQQWAYNGYTCQKWYLVATN